MNNNIKISALKLLDEALKEFESSKGSISSGVLKLNRAAKLINKVNINLWCEVHLGNEHYIYPLKQFAEKAQLYNKIKGKKSKDSEKIVAEYKEALSEMVKIGLIGIKNDKLTFPVISIQEINLKANEHTGGYREVGFLEQKYTGLLKIGNDGTYYLSHIGEHIQVIRANGHKKASALYKQLAFENATKSSFEILKYSVEDRLLDLNPDLAEQIILAFKSIQSDKEEEWSQALSTCRRFLEGLADILYPATDIKIGGRVLGKNNYINRIWAFMDDKIESESNKELAKTHIDFLGSYLQKTFRLTNKGVHTGIDKIEAVKTVFHTYLIAVDLLAYLKMDVDTAKTNLNINNATLDDLEVILGINRNTAKEIVKKRIENGEVTMETLKGIRGIGKKTIEVAREKFDLH